MTKLKKLNRLIKKILAYILIGWPIVVISATIILIKGLLAFLFIAVIETGVVVIAIASMIYGAVLLERSNINNGEVK